MFALEIKGVRTLSYTQSSEGEPTSTKIIGSDRHGCEFQIVIFHDSGSRRKGAAERNGSTR